MICFDIDIYIWNLNLFLCTTETILFSNLFVVYIVVDDILYKRFLHYCELVRPGAQKYIEQSWIPAA